MVTHNSSFSFKDIELNVETSFIKFRYINKIVLGNIHNESIDFDLIYTFCVYIISTILLIKNKNNNNNML